MAYMRFSPSRLSLLIADSFQRLSWFREDDNFICVMTRIPIGSTHVINSSHIIDNIQNMCQTGLAILSIFYCDFRNTNKQNAHNLLLSILIQLCHQSDTFSQVLSIRKTPFLLFVLFHAFSCFSEKK